MFQLVRVNNISAQFVASTQDHKLRTRPKPTKYSFLLPWPLISNLIFAWIERVNRINLHKIQTYVCIFAHHCLCLCSMCCSLTFRIVLLYCIVLYFTVWSFAFIGINFCEDSPGQGITSSHNLRRRSSRNQLKGSTNSLFIYCATAAGFRTGYQVAAASASPISSSSLIKVWQIAN